MKNAKQAESDEIIIVNKYFVDNGEVLVKCPHCERILGLQSGEFKGEQFFDKLCKGQLEVAYTAKRISDPDKL